MKRHSPKKKAPKAGWTPAKGAKSSSAQTKQLRPSDSGNRRPTPQGSVVARGPDGLAIELRGQEGKALLALVRAGAAGCTSCPSSEFLGQMAA